MLSGLTIRQTICFSTISVLKGVDDHCGYRLPWDPLQWLGEQDTRFHDVHHQAWGIKVSLLILFLKKKSPSQTLDTTLFRSSLPHSNPASFQASRPSAPSGVFQATDTFRTWVTVQLLPALHHLLGSRLQHRLRQERRRDSPAVREREDGGQGKSGRGGGGGGEEEEEGESGQSLKSGGMERGEWVSRGRERVMCTVMVYDWADDVNGGKRKSFFDPGGCWHFTISAWKIWAEIPLRSLISLLSDSCRGKLSFQLVVVETEVVPQSQRSVPRNKGRPDQRYNVHILLV